MSGILLGACGSAGGNEPVATITLTNQLVADIVNDPDDAEATLQLGTDGKVYQITSGGALELYDWCVPNDNAALYEVFAQLLGGALDGSSSDTGVWLALNSDRTWTVTADDADEVNSASLTLAIRAIGTTNILVQADVG